MSEKNYAVLYYLDDADIEFVNNLDISVEDKKRLIHIYAHLVSNLTSASITSILGNVHALKHLSGEELIDAELTTEDIYRELDSVIIEKAGM